MEPHVEVGPRNNTVALVAVVVTLRFTFLRLHFYDFTVSDLHLYSLVWASSSNMKLEMIKGEWLSARV